MKYELGHEVNSNGAMNPIPARPHENLVREALLRVLRQHGTGRRKDDCVSVRLIDDALWSGVYTVSIAYPAAKSALPEVLTRMDTSSEAFALGVWVLDASEAWELCVGASGLAMGGRRVESKQRVSPKRSTDRRSPC